ncbi:PepSY domain-containing protein [Cellulophaga baltica]|uniref:PepSY-associated TM helix domain-containing protein n=1 Tax=Cellulophaga TaxID=104264 RepID=UPI001C0710DE|nr:MULTISPECIES: PepSY-associated TM helix domain-containing protein [Cellulophaga]MBU2996463.1 PepSY domain-containing protein [Cellulophaga baltica]MDO6767857.1 PepSY domain-containing protein [Cellulophaga sp. 1_MG-2023]
MKNRTYNILFHTHTVSGIVISVVLYIIFFAGSFSFFRDEIVNWERNHTVKTTDDLEMNIDQSLDSLSTNYDLYGRDIELKKYYIEQQVGVYLGASKDSLANDKAKASDFFYLDTKNFDKTTYEDSYTLGEFLYRLHFLTQIPYPIGYYLSGFVALFFLFAIVTGVLVHWKKIVSNFYVFRPFSKLKTMWTDAHTTLGMLGLPFQFVYAVTGAFFMIKLLLIAPSVMIIYDGDEAKFYEDLGYSHPHFEFENSPTKLDFSINDCVDKVKEFWPDFKVVEAHIFNYGDNNMHVSINGHVNYENKFNGFGEVIIKPTTQEVVFKKNPYDKTSYLDAIKNILYRIHYGDYGGYTLKIISLILGLITCFVIISGVMIWLVARDKKNVPEKKRKFNEKVVRIYLAICLSMYPVTALSFIAVKVGYPADKFFIYSFYFISWLVFSVFYILKKDNNFTNKNSILLGSIFGLLVPVANGIVTKKWFWNNYLQNNIQILSVDLLWILISILGFFVYKKLVKKV